MNVTIENGIIVMEKYQIFDEINHGCFSTVFEAENIQTKKKCAIKVTDLSKYEQDEIQKIQREIDLLHKMSHNNIIQFLDVFQQNSLQYCVMPLLLPIANLHVTTLADEERYLMCKKIAIDLLNAIKYMSTVDVSDVQRGIVHRSIKQDDIVVKIDDESNYSIILIDFNVARGLPIHQQMMTIDTGNIYHKAPECFGDNPQYSTASDLWAVGILLFEYATKNKAYQPLSQRQIRSGKVRAVSDDVDPELKSLITDLLCLDPEVRIAAMNAFLQNNIETAIQQCQFKINNPFIMVKFDLKQYEVREQIKGTEIYRLTKNNQQFCAVRIDKKGLDNERIQSIKKEKDFLAKQNFKYVFKIVEIIDCKDSLYKIYQEFTPIQVYLSDKTQNDIQKVIISTLLDICMLLKYLQQKLIFLKNITPTNLVLFAENNQMNATIIDYSYCSAITQAVPKQSKYHAPEVWEENQCSLEGDVWSTGISCFELASKEDPYKDKSDADIKKGTYNQLPVSINKMSQSIIKQMLQTKEKRLQCIQKVLSNPQLKHILIMRLDEKQQLAQIGINQIAPIHQPTAVIPQPIPPVAPQQLKKSTYFSLTNLTKLDTIYPLTNGKNQIRNQKAVLYSNFVTIQRNQNSCVYCCEDQTEANNCKQVVMKVQDIYSKSQEQVDKIIQEMNIKPDHKSLIKVIDGFIEESKGAKYVITIMEKGFSFKEFFTNGMKVDVLIKIIQECCYGLLYMLGENPDKYGCYEQDGVRHQFIHRDIKPANIIIHGTKEDWSAAIIDFNACKELVNKNKPQKYTGTLGFMAPEIENLEEGQFYTKACDVYSLGKTILAWMKQYNIYHDGITKLVDMMNKNLPENRPTLEAVLEMLENPNQIGEHILEQHKAVIVCVEDIELNFCESVQTHTNEEEMNEIERLKVETLDYQEQVIYQQQMLTQQQQQQIELQQQIHKMQMVFEQQQKQINEKDETIKTLKEKLQQFENQIYQFENDQQHQKSEYEVENRKKENE